MMALVKNSAWIDNPDYRMDITNTNERIRILFNNLIIADSGAALILQENDYKPLYYFPRENLRMDLMQASSKISFCPYKGDAQHWSLSVGERRVEIAAWSYCDPFTEVEQIKNYISFYPEAIEELQIR
ncbi:MAG: DUF427 domain-containing protein [Thiohalomonadales bacterium]